MGKRAWLFAILAAAVGVALVMLLLQLRDGPPRAEGTAAAPPEATPAPSRPPPPARPTPPRPRTLEPVAPPPEAAPAEPAGADDAPISALIVTFPDGTEVGEVDSLYARCGLQELRRSGNHVRLNATDGNWEKAKECIRATAGIVAGVERGMR